jgi:hypothetical protein
MCDIVDYRVVVVCIYFYLGDCPINYLYVLVRVVKMNFFCVWRGTVVNYNQNIS